MSAVETSAPLLFFDGECNLCNGAVQFIIRRDKKEQFMFAALQSARGQKAKGDLSKIPEFSANEPDSFILYYKGRYFIKSTAALETAKLLGGLWRMAAIGFILPGFIRDWVYDFVARNRYKWFGKRNECMIPTPQLKRRFLD
jgi:predicted DCC family thiol-disulfide oxidoreductase YuxK